MSVSPSLPPELAALPPEEKFRLAEQLWQAAEAESPLDAQTAAILDERLAQLERGEVDLIPWEQVKAELMARLKRP